MKFINKKTKVIVETSVKAIEEMYKNKAGFEEVKEAQPQAVAQPQE